MLQRWLLKYAALTIVHAFISCVAVVIVVAAAMSPGTEWLLRLTVILWDFLFFPLLCLDWAGIELVPIDSPLAIAINSPTWSAIVSAIWLVASRYRHRKLNKAKRVDETMEL